MNFPLTVAAPAAATRLDWRTIAMALLFAIAALFLTTAANRFPSSYHPDEPSKARQILDHEYNFHHPLLLLDATRLIIGVAHVPTDTDAVTIAGRCASAIFNAGAIFCLVLLAALLGGPLAGFIAGCLLVINHQLFDLAHYFKEDAAVLFGISAFFLALTLYDRAPSLGRAAVLGATLGLAVSGKYLGAVVAPCALILIWMRPRRIPALLVFLAIALGVIALLNLPAILQFASFTGGISREVDLAVNGEKGVTRSIPHGVYWKVFIDSTMSVRWLPVVAVLLATAYFSLISRRRTASAAEWMTALFPVAFALMLSFVSKTNSRYFLPATGMLLMLASTGAVSLSLLVWKGRPIFGRLGARYPALVALGICLATEAPTFVAYFRGFHHDGRTAMADYVTQHIPPDTVIVQDKAVDLDALKLPYRFQGKQLAAEVGTIDELRAQGIEYVAVAESNYGKFFKKSDKPTEKAAAQFARNREFYERLFHEGEKLFECPAGTLQYLQPHILLYRLPPR